MTTKRVPAERVIRIDQTAITAPNYPRSTEWWQRFLPIWFTHQRWWEMPNSDQLVNSGVTVEGNDVVIRTDAQRVRPLLRYLTTGVLARYISQTAITLEQQA